MRNLFRVLLVSSALVAVSAPSAYAALQDIADLAASPTGGAQLAGQVTSELELLGPQATAAEKAGLLKNALALCGNGDAACVANILAAFADPAVNVKLTAEEIAEVADIKGLDADDYSDYIAAVDNGGGGTNDTPPESASGSTGSGDAPVSGT